MPFTPKTYERVYIKWIDMENDKHKPKDTKLTLKVNYDVLIDDVDCVVVNGKKFIPATNLDVGSEIIIRNVVYRIDSMVLAMVAGRYTAELNLIVKGLER